MGGVGLCSLKLRRRSPLFSQAPAQCAMISRPCHSPLKSSGPAVRVCFIGAPVLGLAPGKACFDLLDTFREEQSFLHEIAVFLQ